MPAEERQLSNTMTDLPSISIGDAELLAKDKDTGAISKVDGKISNISQTATEADLKVGNYFALDGTDGTMRLPAEVVAKASNFYSVIDLNDSANWVTGGVDSNSGACPTASTNRISTNLFKFNPLSVFSFTRPTAGSSYSYSIYCYDGNKNYLGYKQTTSVSLVVQDYPEAKWFRFGLTSIAGVSPITADNVSNIIHFSKQFNVEKYAEYNDVTREIASVENHIDSVENQVEELFTDKTANVNLNDSEYWVAGGVDSHGEIVENTSRLTTKQIRFSPSASLSFTRKSGVSFSYATHAYDVDGNYLGYKQTTSVSLVVQDYPTAYSFRLALMNVSGVDVVSTDNLANIATFGNPPVTIDGYETRLKKLESKVVDVGFTDKLYGKIWYACGDSFTEGVSGEVLTDGKYKGKNKVYPYIIGNRTGMDVHNIARSGSTITYSESESTASDCFTYPTTGRLYSIPENADYITLKFGINDAPDHKNRPLGTINDTTNTTLYGAWNVAISYLIGKCPFAKIGIIVTNGCNDERYSLAAKDIAMKWGLGFLDENFGYDVPLLHRVSGKPLVARAAHQARMEAFRVSPTNTHPNGLAHEYESTFVEHWLRSL